MTHFTHLDCICSWLSKTPLISLSAQSSSVGLFGQLSNIDNRKKHCTITSAPPTCDSLYLRTKTTSLKNIGDNPNINKLQPNSLSGFAVETGFWTTRNLCREDELEILHLNQSLRSFDPPPSPRRSRRRSYKIIYIKIWNQIYSFDVEKDRWRYVTYINCTLTCRNQFSQQATKYCTYWAYVGLYYTHSYQMCTNYRPYTNLENSM